MQQQQKPEFEPQARHIPLSQTQFSNIVIVINKIKKANKKRKEKKKVCKIFCSITLSRQVNLIFYLRKNVGGRTLDSSH